MIDQPTKLSVFIAVNKLTVPSTISQDAKNKSRRHRTLTESAVSRNRDMSGEFLFILFCSGVSITCSDKFDFDDVFPRVGKIQYKTNTNKDRFEGKGKSVEMKSQVSHFD